ncbi:MAG TPA: response regulator, partial [Magnetospirillaceae bacterium]|nr:response regulator [Magnetospirillaceae bacterium]
MESTAMCMLLVDDEPSILNALRRELADWAEERGLEILTAHSAPAGLELLESRGESTLIAVSDLKMPGMLGSDFLLAVKARFPNIVTLLLTGYSETRELTKAVSAGIFSYLQKPWDSADLLVEVQKAYLHGETRRENLRYARMIDDELKWAGEMQKAILRPNIPNSEG